MDAFASPRVQAARKRIGEAFERALEAMLRHLGVPFATEGDMRCVGGGRGHVEGAGRGQRRRGALCSA